MRKGNEKRGKTNMEEWEMGREGKDPTLHTGIGNLL